MEDHAPQILITGCARSGTSVMMAINIAALGMDRCQGSKHPIANFLEKMAEQSEDETDAHYKSRMYSHDIDPERRKYEDALADSMDMNPGGFWEMGRPTIQGIKYRQGETLPADGFCKVICSGLAKTDPKYVKKVIYMARHPRAVAKSQERLRRRGIPEQTIGAIHNAGNFINEHVAAANWIGDNPDVPILVVDFDRLIENPAEQLGRLADFLGEGNWTKASGVIEPKLRRSNHEDIEDELWPDAERIYRHLLASEFSQIVAFSEERQTAMRQDGDRWVCARRLRVVSHRNCQQCISDPTVRGNYRKTATKDRVDWKHEPCLFECGLDRSLDDSEIKTFEESVKDNFWIEEEAQRQHINCTHRSLEIADSRECKSCGGSIKILVFPCSVRGLCSIKKNVGSDVTVCGPSKAHPNGCPDYKAPDDK